MMGPWVMVGDFNQVVSLEDKRRGSHRWWNKARKLQRTLDVCGMMDLGF